MLNHYALQAMQIPFKNVIQVKNGQNSEKNQGISS